MSRRLVERDWDPTTKRFPAIRGANRACWANRIVDRKRVGKSYSPMTSLDWLILSPNQWPLTVRLPVVLARRSACLPAVKPVADRH